MNELNALFRRRIGLSANEKLTFESLSHVLNLTAGTIPFENLRIVEHRTNEISIDNLTTNLLVNREGGLCYELNSLLYHFLLENGFDAVLTRGIVYNYDTQAFVTLGRTHVTILLTHEGQTYLVDTGFGGNLPLNPVPLTGETTASRNGEFRVTPVNGEHGDYLMEMKLKHKHADWRIGYAFDSKKRITDLTEFNEIQRIIAEHPQSSFNKHPLLTKLTKRGSLTLTDTSLTQWEDGSMTKENIDSSSFQELLKEHFGR